MRNPVTARRMPFRMARDLTLLVLACASGCSVRSLAVRGKQKGGRDGMPHIGFDGGPRADACLPEIFTDGHPSGSIGSDGASTAGAPSFGTRTRYEVGSLAPVAVAIADVNGDGKPDLITANWDVTNDDALARGVSVLLNQGGGAFARVIEYPNPLGSASIAVADVNADGKVDLAVGGGYGVGGYGVGVWMNNGAGAFAPPAIYDTGGMVDSVAFADIDGDGAADMIVANGLSASSGDRDGVAVLRNDGAGKFFAPARYASGLEPWSLAVGEVNGDDRVDVAITGPCGGYVLVNNGKGGLAEPLHPAGVKQELTLGDADGDGRTDIITTNYEWSVDVLVGNDDGTFAPPSRNPVQDPVRTVASDIDGDGRVDLVVGSGMDGPGVSILLNAGGGRFAAALNYPTGDRSAHFVAVGDLNADGKADIAVTGKTGVTVLLNTSP
jgi:hypothetical protein